MPLERFRKAAEAAKRSWRAIRGRRLPSSNNDARLELHTERIATHRGGYLSVVVIVRNEALDIREWVEFQRLVGVQHVYLYDDASTDDTRAVLAPFVEQGFVTVVPWSRFLRTTGQQFMAYAHALTTFGPAWRWMAFLDRDEYLFPVSDESLALTLSQYEDLPAVVVPWHMFGFNGHARRPPGLVIENYTQRLPFPPPPAPATLLRWKSIVNPSAVYGVANCHFFELAPNHIGGYTEDRTWVDAIPGGWRNASTKVFRLNHYFAQSEEDFARRRSTRHDPASAFESDRNWKRVQEMKHAIQAADSVHDDLILRYVPRLAGGLAMTPDTVRPLAPPQRITSTVS